MKLRLQPGSLSELSEALEAFSKEAKELAQNAMAVELRTMVLETFGPNGTSRISAWPLLTKKYANQYHDGDTTPTLVLTERLRDSIDLDFSDPDASRVLTEVPYAAIHQWGLETEEGNPMSPRPFFPLVGDENDSVLSPEAEDRLRAAAEDAITQALQTI